MTLLVSWIGVDTHGTSSAYIAADSRIGWDDRTSFDLGRKVFAFQNSPDILGYCGDVLFPTMVLSQIKEMADSGILFPDNASCKEKFEAIKEKLVQQFRQYPHLAINLKGVQVIHISRDNSDNKKFSCRLITWNQGSGWAGKTKQLPKSSDILFVLGSGKQEFMEKYYTYKVGPTKDTSRSVFQCFCNTLSNVKDKYCGGAPQLVGIYRKPSSSAITFGIINEKKRYYLGTQVDSLVGQQDIIWRNDLFEICDGITLQRKPDAQKQPDELRNINDWQLPGRP